MLSHADGEWVKILDAQSLNSGNEEPTSAFTLLEQTASLGWLCTAAEWKLSITGAATDDVTMRLYGAPGGVAASQSSEAKQVATLSCAAIDPYLADGVWNWDEIGSGALVTFQRTGSESGIAVTMWIRRLRWH